MSAPLVSNRPAAPARQPLGWNLTATRDAAEPDTAPQASAAESNAKNFAEQISTSLPADVSTVSGNLVVIADNGQSASQTTPVPRSQSWKLPAAAAATETVSNASARTKSQDRQSATAASTSIALPAWAAPATYAQQPSLWSLPVKASATEPASSGAATPASSSSSDRAANSAPGFQPSGDAGPGRTAAADTAQAGTLQPPAAFEVKIRNESLGAALPQSTTTELPTGADASEPTPAGTPAPPFSMAGNTAQSFGAAFQAGTDDSLNRTASASTTAAATSSTSGGVTSSTSAAPVFDSQDDASAQEPASSGGHGGDRGGAKSSAGRGAVAARPDDDATRETRSSSVRTPQSEQPFAAYTKDAMPAALAGDRNVAAAAKPLSAQFESELSEAHPAPVRSLNVKLQNDQQQSVNLSVTERAGELHVSVRSDAPELQTALRGGLDSLQQSFDQKGIHAEISAPARGAQSGGSGSSRDASHDGSSSAQSQESPSNRWSGGRQGQRRQNQPEWDPQSAWAD